MPPVVREQQKPTPSRAAVSPLGRFGFISAVSLAVIIVCGAIFLIGQRMSTVTVDSQNLNSPPSAQAALAQLRPVRLTLSGERTISLRVPTNYSITVAADGFKRLRFMAWSPDHRLFVGEMTSASDTNTGRVVVFDDFDEAAGSFQASHIYLSGLRNPNSVAFYTDPGGREWLYVALTDTLLRYPYRHGSIAPDTEPQILATFPGSGRELMAGGWHLTRTLAFNRDELFVSIGSSCNSCEEKETDRAVIIKMNADGSNKRVYASGLRNAVGITFAKGALYATANESDQLGSDKPNDVVYRVEDGVNYGWPYCYQYKGTVYKDETTAWQTSYDCSKVPLAFAELEPHSAPLGLEYFDNTFTDPALHDSLLVAEHGSGKLSIGTGNRVSLVRRGTSTPFLDGFLQNGVRQGRAVHILRNDNSSFFVTDDLNGIIYYLKSGSDSV